MMTPIPPFEPGEEALKDLTDEQKKLIDDRVAADQHFDLLPCVWFEPKTRCCLFYEKRPDACRRFEIGSDLCRLSRCDIGLPG
jgi:Fe-S-cluster containining protein